VLGCGCGNGGKGETFDPARALYSHVRRWKKAVQAVDGAVAAVKP
jgi:hypothetical protein